MALVVHRPVGFCQCFFSLALLLWPLAPSRASPLPHLECIPSVGAGLLAKAVLQATHLKQARPVPSSTSQNRAPWALPPSVRGRPGNTRPGSASHAARGSPACLRPIPPPP